MKKAAAIFLETTSFNKKLRDFCCKVVSFLRKISELKSTKKTVQYRISCEKEDRYKFRDFLAIFYA